MSKFQRSQPPGASAYGALTPQVEAPIVGRAAKSRTTEVPESVTSEVTKSRTARAAKTAAPAAGDEPRYLQLARKEARLRVEQVDALAYLTRQLNRRRTHRGGERLTDNTLIRVAVDVLLARAEDLHGNTEQELRASLGLNPGR